MSNKNEPNFNYKYIFFGLGIFFLFFFYLTKGINYPFVGYNAWNFNIYSLIAHNYHNWGLFSSNLAPIISVSRETPLSYELYINHPPLISILQFFAFYLFGEGYLSARVPVVLLSGISLYIVHRLVFLLTKNKDLSYLSSFVFAILPATTIFGKMIGQEALLLCILLGFSYFLFKYLDNYDIKYFFVSLLLISLGVFTDWPIYYFIFFIVIYLIILKKYKLALLYFGYLIFNLIVYLVWVGAVAGGFDFLVNAFLTRSITEVYLSFSYLINTFLTLIVRYLFYFNPIVVVFSLLGLFKIIKNKNRDRFKDITLIFLIFGITHIVLYPYGALGHPYWMYYLTVFVCFSSSIFIYNYLLKRKAFFIFFVLICISYSFLVVEWKSREIKGNFFRYYIAKIATNEIPKYSAVGVLEESLIDQDLLQYGFKLKPYSIEDKIHTDTDFLLFTCVPSCININKKYSYDQYSSYKNKEVEVVILGLNKNEKKYNLFEFTKIMPESRGSLFKKIYNEFVNRSLAPQL